MDISCFHKRKIEKSWLPSSILIPYAFQHDFLGLFIRVKNMRCSILSQVENFSVKINLKVESREKTRRLYTIPLHFIRGCFQHCWLAKFWIKKNFPWNAMYCGKQWLLQRHAVMKKGEPICKMNLAIVWNLISYF